MQLVFFRLYLILHACAARFDVIVWGEFFRTKPSHNVLDITRDENGTDIFRPYSRPDPFRGV